MRLSKIIVVVLLLILSSVILVSHQTYSLFPWVAFGTISVVAILIIASFHYRRNNSSYHILLLFIIVTSVFVRSYQFWFPPSFTGGDPDLFAVWVRSILDQGVMTMEAGFYSKAPLMPVFGAISTMITGVQKISLGIISIALGIFIPLASASMGRILSAEYKSKAGLLAATLGGMTTYSIARGIFPIAQSIGIVFVMGSLLALFVLLETEDHRMTVIFTVFGIASLFTHKLPLFIMSGILLVFFVQGWSLSIGADKLSGYKDLIEIIYDDRSMLLNMIFLIIFVPWAILTSLFSPPTFPIIGAVIMLAINKLSNIKEPNVFDNSSGTSELKFYMVLSGCLYLIQSIFLTEYAGSVVTGKLLPIIRKEPRKINDVVFENAIQVPLGIYDIFGHQNNFLLLLLIGCFASSLLYLNRPDDEGVRLYASVVLISLIIAPLSLSIVSGHGVGARRLFGSLEPTIAVGVGVVFAKLSKMTVSWRNIILILSLGTICIFQLMAVGAVLDHPAQSRSYLYQSEMSSKEFGSQYAQGTIETDYFLGNERVNPLLGNAGPSSTNRYSSNTIDYFNGVVGADNHYVLYRKKYLTYRSQVSGTWRLTWDPRSTLDNNRNKIYDNNDASIYDKYDS